LNTAWFETKGVRPADEKLSFFYSIIICFSCCAQQTGGLLFDGATGDTIILKNVCSGSSKKISGDTRNTWVTMMFVTKNRYNCFRKQSHIDTCIQAFKELESLGFEFGEFGFAWDHVHFQVNIPKRYSVETAEIMLKSRSARRMFECHPGFRRRYPRGSFWSGYEHHQSTGLTSLEESSRYLRDQQRHHNIVVLGQQRLPGFG